MPFLIPQDMTSTPRYSEINKILTQRITNRTQSKVHQYIKFEETDLCTSFFVRKSEKFQKNIPKNIDVYYQPF